MTILTSLDLLLEDVLRNDEAMSAFMEFMDTEGECVCICDRAHSPFLGFAFSLIWARCLTHAVFPATGNPVLMQFWLLTDNFQQFGDERSSSERRGDALAMYNRFISLAAQEPLGVS